MRVLCDQNVPEKYLSALRDTDGITVTTVAATLEHDATDGEIAARAAAEDWAVFTNATSPSTRGTRRPLLQSTRRPSSGAVVEAIQRVASAYESHEEVVERVPDGWC